MTPQFQADQLLEIKNLWLSLTTHQRAALVAVCRHVGALGPVACEVLVDSAARLGQGAQIGDFDDNRDFVFETLSEVLDQAHYACVALKRLQRSERKSQPRAAE